MCFSPGQETKSKCSNSGTEQNKKDAFLGIDKAQVSCCAFVSSPTVQYQGAFWMLLIGLFLAVVGTTGELYARYRCATSKTHNIVNKRKSGIRKDPYEYTYDMNFTYVHSTSGSFYC